MSAVVATAYRGGISVLKMWYGSDRNSSAPKTCEKMLTVSSTQRHVRQSTSMLWGEKPVVTHTRLVV